MQVVEIGKYMSNGGLLGVYYMAKEDSLGLTNLPLGKERILNIKWHTCIKSDQRWLGREQVIVVNHSLDQN